MDSVLIISSTNKVVAYLKDFLNSINYLQIWTVRNGSEARRLLNENSFDLIIINVPLADETGEELALMIIDVSTSGVLLLVRPEAADEISARVEDYGVFVLVKPLSRQLLFQSLKLITASQRRIQGLQSENVKLQKKVEEIRLVDRAKCALIQHMGFTEAGAHRYIEKQAMDKRSTRREIAENILNIYEC